MRVAGKPRSASTGRMTPPTCPVAPTIPTSIRSGYRRPVLGGRLIELEVDVQGPYRLLDIASAHNTADANRRRGDHLDVHALVGEDLEHPGRHARVRLHPGAHDAHPPDLGVVAD